MDTNLRNARPQLPYLVKEVQSMLITIITTLLIFNNKYILDTAPPVLKSKILSESFYQRREAYNYSMLNIIGNSQNKSKSFLLFVIRTDPLMPPKIGPVNGEEATYSPRRIALSICAEWHNPELIPIFLQFIDYYSPDPNKSNAYLASIPHVDFAAVKGLINIGKQALDPCIHELKKPENNPLRNRGTSELYKKALKRQRNLVYVIWNILGYNEAQALLYKEINILSTNDEESSNNLRCAVEYMESQEIYKK